MGIVPFIHSRRAISGQSLPHRTVPGSPNSGGNSSGISRTRSRDSRYPVHRHRFRNSYIAPSSSENEPDDSEESTSESSDEESCCDIQIGSTKGCILLEDEFQFARQELLRLALEHFRHFIATARYSAPPDDGRIPRTFSWEPSWQLVSTNQEKTANNNDGGDGNDFVLISPPQGYLRFKCPFYASNPEEYRCCLVQHDLLTLENVIKHVKRHHTRPFYCPMCSRTFDTVVQCDEHILERACNIRDLVKPEGINQYQKARLTKRDSRRLSNIQRWWRVYGTIFPGTEEIPSPYLDQGCGRAISIARDFWRREGHGRITKFLQNQSWMSTEEKHDKDTRVALYKLVLEDLIEVLILECG